MRVRLSAEERAVFQRVGAQGGKTAAKRMTAAQRKARSSKGGLAKAAKQQKKATD